MAKLNRNMFNLSREVKMSTKFGQLTPCFVQEILPGDSIKVNTENFMRTAPMVYPVLHRVNVYIHYHFVPYRLLWDKWEDYITGGEDGTDTSVHPFINYDSTNVQDFKTGELADYLGFPVWDANGATPTVTGNVKINAMFFKAYIKIYNDWYRDQDLVPKKDFGFNLSGDQQTIWGQLAQLQNRPFEADYFTASRPSAQKGSPIRFGGATLNWLKTVDDSTTTGGQIIETRAPAGAHTGAANRGDGKELVPNILISDLRRANAIQQFQEAMQRGGGRMIEYLKQIWNVKSNDGRLQNAEFLGGGKQPVTISEVLSSTNTNVAGSGTDSVVGDLYGHGISVGNKNHFSRSFDEYGVVIGLMSVLPRTGYAEGLHKSWRRVGGKFTYPVPHLAHIGEEAVLNEELFFEHTAPGTAVQIGEFGYQDRYADWKYACDTVRGDMRFDLNRWHLNREINAVVNLNQAFVECNPATQNHNRIFNVTDPTKDVFWCQLYHKVDAIRKLPYTGVPELS